MTMGRSGSGAPGGVRTPCYPASMSADDRRRYAPPRHDGRPTTCPNGHETGVRDDGPAEDAPGRTYFCTLCAARWTIYEGPWSSP